MTVKKKFKKLVLLYDTLKILFGFIKMVFKPNDISPIFVTGSFREHPSFELAVKAFKSKPEVNELIEKRYLSKEPFSLEELIKYPKGSLANEFATHMIENKLNVVFYPPMEDNRDDDINYLINRGRQTHDIHHVILGFPAVDIGEMKISAFYLSQNPIPLSAFLLGMGFWSAVIKQPHRLNELFNGIIEGWVIGKQAKDFFGIKWEEYWDKNIDSIREELNVKMYKKTPDYQEVSNILVTI